MPLPSAAPLLVITPPPRLLLPPLPESAGQGRRLDGKPATSSPTPPAYAAAAAAAARMAAAAGASTSGSGGGSGSRPGSSGGEGVPRSKAGTFVSTGNRLLDKLQREKVGKEKLLGRCGGLGSNGVGHGDGVRDVQSGIRSW